MTAMTPSNIKTPLPGPNAKAIIDRDTAVVSPSYTRGYPLVIARGDRRDRSRTSTATCSSTARPASRSTPPATRTRRS